jgi:hypothetical protein
MTKTPGEVEPFKPIPCVRARAFRLRNSPNQREGALVRSAEHSQLPDS